MVVSTPGSSAAVWLMVSLLPVFRFMVMLLVSGRT